VVNQLLAKGERAGEVDRTLMGDAIDASEERVASAAAEPLRQTPIGAAAGEREAENGIRRVVIVHAGRIAERTRRHVVRADGRIAVGRAAAAEARSPCGPTLLERWNGRLKHRCLEHLRRRADRLRGRTPEVATYGLSIRFKNSLVSANALRSAPVAFSPLNCVSALARSAPLRLNRLAKAGGSVPPKLKKLLIALASFRWSTFSVGLPSAAVRSGNASPVL